MAEYCLSCCSTVDLTKEYLEKRELRYICFHYELDGRQFVDDLWNSNTPQELYRMMEEGAEAKTSQVNVSEYTAYFEEMLKQGKDILHVTLSSGITGTVNSARIAKEELEERYPDRKIYVVDSLAASSGYGLLMDKLADLRDQGMDIDSLYHWTEEHKLEMHHWFFSTDLTYYIKGGRISKTAGFVGNVLNICPLLNVDMDGRLTLREKVRGKKKVRERMVAKVMEHISGGTDYAEKCFLCHSLCEEDAHKVAESLQEKCPKMQIEIYPIGATIGCHTGPGTVAVFFWGDKRED